MAQPPRGTQLKCVVEARELGGMLKLGIARMFRNDQLMETFSIVSDEGPHLGGEGSAPTPLMYFVAGVAF